SKRHCGASIARRAAISNRRVSQAKASYEQCLTACHPDKGRNLAQKIHRHRSASAPEEYPGCRTTPEQPARTDPSFFRMTGCAGSAYALVASSASSGSLGGSSDSSVAASTAASDSAAASVEISSTPSSDSTASAAAVSSTSSPSGVAASSPTSASSSTSSSSSSVAGTAPGAVIAS